MKPEATHQDDHLDHEDDVPPEEADYYISDLDGNSEDASGCLQNKRISCRSKVNFSKLSD